MGLPPRLLLVGVPALLGLAGLLLVAAARERWAAVCPFWGDYETGPCLARQDHGYDFLPPVEPWLPVGDAATLAGVALLVLAVAAAGVPFLMLGAGHPMRGTVGHRALVVVSAAVLSLSTVGIGWWALLSGREGRVLEPWPAPAYGIGWAIGWPLVLVTLAAVATGPGIRGDGWRWLTVLLLVGTTPLGMYVAAPALLGYVSYDTAPWTEASAGILLLLAAPVLWRAGVVGAQPVPAAGRGPVAQSSNARAVSS